MATTAWMVRGGRGGERERRALGEGLAIAGWEEMDDLSALTTRQLLRSALDRTYPGERRARVANWSGQLWRFLHEMDIDDLVAMPLRSGPEVAIGRIAGPYQYRDDEPPGFRHVRAVTWVRPDVPRSAIRQDLLDSLGSLMTVCRLERFDAAARLAHLADTGLDPGPREGTGVQDLGATSKQELAEKVAAAESGEDVRITIRELLSLWGAVRRGAEVVSRIDAELTEMGLVTRPSFTEGWIDNQVTIVEIGEEPTHAAESGTTEAARADEDSPTAITLRIGELRSANLAHGLASVRPTDDICTATTMMIAENYSQLPVVDDDGNLRGAVSWESIGMARVSGDVRTVSAATVGARAVDHDEDLLNLIEEIYRIGYLFVRGTDNSTVGIVTAADLTVRFGELARPLVLIEEAERRLRRRFDEVFSADEIRKFSRTGKATCAADLTVGDYHHTLVKNAQGTSNWARLGWPLDYALFVDRLEQVRDIRNEFMHFSPDPLTAEQMGRVASFVRLLRTADPRA